MDFNLSEEQKLLQSSVREVAALEIAPKAAEADSYNLFAWEGTQALAQAGYMGLLIPPEYGGSGSDPLSFVLVAEEVGKVCPNTALVFVTHQAASRGIALGGQPGLKQRWLPLLVQGSKLAAFAATEAEAGSNVLAIQTTAQPQGDHYLVNGSKLYITSCDEAEVYLTVVRTSPAPGPGSLSLLVLEKGMEGISLGRKFIRMGMNGTSNGEYFFSNVKVPRENLVGPEGGYMPLGMAVAGIGLLGAGGIALGIAEAVLGASLAYGKQRTVLGQPLGNYQAVQFMASEMSTLVEAGRCLLYWAASTHPTARPGPPLHAIRAKLFTAEMALRVTDIALQLHGGSGYTKEFPLERFYRDARGLTLHFGVTEPLKELLGKALMGLLPG